MARQRHLEAARLHLEAANRHLEVADKYRDGDHAGAARRSAEAWAASRVAESKSVEAHGESSTGVGEELG
jgi:hypothetical protein